MKDTGKSPQKQRQKMSTVTEDVKLSELLCASIDLARRGGETIKGVRASGALDTKQKGVDDPVTRADLETQAIVVGGLRTLWPRIAIVGEESVYPDPDPKAKPPARTGLVAEGVVPPSLASIPLSELAVFIDPLDATREFVEGNAEPVMVLIGISRKGVPIAGVTYQPFVGGGRLIYGVVGGRVEGITPKVRGGWPHDILFVASSSSDKATAAEVAKKIGSREPRFLGGCSCKMLHVLEGKADVYVNPGKGTKLWDTCAAHALITAAGGRVTDAKGRDLVYLPTSKPGNDDGLIISMEHHADYVAAINK